MSIKFSQLKTAYGLDDVLIFPRHRGKTVKQIIADDPSYIDWLMRNTNTRFYESVYETLDEVMPEIPRNTNINKPSWYPKYDYDQRGLSDFDDWFDDIPF